MPALSTKHARSHPDLPSRTYETQAGSSIPPGEMDERNVPTEQLVHDIETAKRDPVESTESTPARPAQDEDKRRRRPDDLTTDEAL